MSANRHGLTALGVWAAVAAAAAGGEVRVTTTAELQAAVAKLKPGTTVLIAPGTYTGGVAIRGAAGTRNAPIVIRGADPKQPPLLKGGNEALHLSDCVHVTLKDLAVAGCRDNGINIDDGGSFATPSRRIVVENVTIREVGPQGNHDALKMSGVEEFVVRGCRFEGWGGSAIDMVGCHRGVVEDCTFVGRAGFSGHSGIQLKGGTEHVLVQTSAFRDAGQRAINLGGSTGLDYFRPKVGDFEARDITVAGNRFFGSEAPIAFVTAVGGHVHHNTFVDPGKWLLRILQESRDARFRPCREGVFEHNLVVYDRRLQVFVNVGPGTAPETFVFRHNAWFNASGKADPKLPTKEADGVYDVNPALTAEGKVTSGDKRLAKVGADAYQRPAAGAGPAAATRPAVPQIEPVHVGVRVEKGAVAPVRYLQLVLRARTLAERAVCLSNLKAVGTALMLYEQMNGRMPAALGDLVKAGLVAAQAIRSPIKEGGEFSYVPRPSMRGTPGDILVFDGKVSYAGQCCALRLDGSVVTMSPEALEAAVASTYDRLKRK